MVFVYLLTDGPQIRYVGISGNPQKRFWPAFYEKQRDRFLKKFLVTQKSPCDNQSVIEVPYEALILRDGSPQ